VTDAPLRYATLAEMLQAMQDMKPDERLSEVLARKGLKSPLQTPPPPPKETLQ
jgi:hypothetical protein